MGSLRGKAPTVEEDPNERALAEVGNREWQHYTKFGIPLENAYAQRIERMRSPAGRERFKGAGVATVEQSVGNDIEAGGVNPNTGMGVRRATDRAAVVGSARTQAALHGDQAGEDRYYKGRLSQIDLGRNQATEGIAGMSRAAQLGTQKAIGDVAASVVERNARHQAAGAVAGYGLSKYMTRKKPKRQPQYPTGDIDYEEDVDEFFNPWGP